ncbi:MAG TPA: NAD(P)/FAD-dependent oxidoreductase [Candidatus Limnocylindria bacterium]|nr:NAD(P)/FAD-dependent oxidoreductase [Candidatus Limnocylindria bacterium]
MSEGTAVAERRPHRVLILGGGFGGVTTAQALERRLGRRRDVEIWLVSSENFLLFTPLLPEVCSGILEPRHVVAPLRGMVHRRHTWCVTAEVEKIDLGERTVVVMGGDGHSHRLGFDTLVLALGGITHTFDIPGIEEQAMGMKTLADAFSLRNRIIEMLERAEIEEDPAARQAQLTFVVGGAGSSGVETVGEIEGFIRHLRQRYYPEIRDDEIQIHLVELGDQVLREMTPEMGEYAARRLARRGIQIHLNTPLTKVSEHEVVVGAGGARLTIPTRTLIWTGGVRPAPVVAESGIEVDHAGRAVTRPTMETSQDGVFAIGDCAAIPDTADPKGRPFAPTAQNAVREGRQLAANIVSRIDGGTMAPFHYRPLGTLASIGRRTGVGTVFGIHVRGWIAWFMWRGYYWSRLPGFNRKLHVAFDWLLTALFGADPVQLKVEDVKSAMGSSGRRRPPHTGQD